jgi:hypothetical protein
MRRGVVPRTLVASVVAGAGIGGSAAQALELPIPSDGPVSGPVTRTVDRAVDTVAGTVDRVAQAAPVPAVPEVKVPEVKVPEVKVPAPSVPAPSPPPSAPAPDRPAAPAPAPSVKVPSVPKVGVAPSPGASAPSSGSSPSGPGASVPRVTAPAPRSPRAGSGGSQPRQAAGPRASAPAGPAASPPTSAGDSAAPATGSGSAPSGPSGAGRTGIRPSTVVRADGSGPVVRVRTPRRARSRFDASGFGAGSSLHAAAVGDGREPVEHTVTRLQGCLPDVSASQREVLSLRAGIGPALPLSRGQVAGRLALGLPQVRRIETNGLRRLDALGSAGFCGPAVAGGLGAIGAAVLLPAGQLSAGMPLAAPVTFAAGSGDGAAGSESGMAIGRDDSDGDSGQPRGGILGTFAASPQRPVFGGPPVPGDPSMGPAILLTTLALLIALLTARHELRRR